MLVYVFTCLRQLHLLLFFELAHVQVVVKTFFREQFIVFAALDDLTVFEDEDHIRVADGG